MREVVPEKVWFDGAGVRLAGDRWAISNSKGIVLLLHGAGQTRHSWQRAGERLARDGWEAITLDHRGHGESEWAPDGDYDISTFAADAIAVTETLPEKPVIVGASLGGLTGLYAEGEHGDVARALILVDIALRVEPEGSQRIGDFMRRGASSGFSSLEEVAAAIQEYQPHRQRSVNHESLLKNVRQRDDGRWYWHWDPAFTLPGDGDEEAQKRRRELFEAMRVTATRITVPTLVIRGEHSDVLSPAGVTDMMELIPHARHVEVPNTRHMVAGDDNDVFSQEVLRFLDFEVATTDPR